MPTYRLLVGSKVQVYRGIAKETSGGLTKKDIVMVTDKNGVNHYKSRKQQNNGKSRNKVTAAPLINSRILSAPCTRAINVPVGR